MADIEFKPGAPGGGHTRKKGFKLNSPMIYIIGGVVIVGFLLLRSRQQASQDAAAVYAANGQLADYPQPSNSVDMASQLQSFEDAWTQQQNAAFDEFGKQIASSIDALGKKFPTTEKPTSNTPKPTPKPAKDTSGPSKYIPKPTKVSHVTTTKKKSSTKTYVIRKGDTLSELATKFYGNAYHGGLKKLEGLNKQIKDPNKIYAGQKIHY